MKLFKKYIIISTVYIKYKKENKMTTAQELKINNLQEQLNKLQEKATYYLEQELAAKIIKEEIWKEMDALDAQITDVEDDEDCEKYE